MKIENITYQDGKHVLEATASYNLEKAPLILLFHAWKGKDKFIIDKAKEIAEKGFICIALDMYGKGIFGNTTEECSKLIEPFMKDRKLLQKRILSGYDMARKLDYVDQSKIAAIGFCFGGLCALDLARSGVDIKGVVSFHGLLNGHSLEKKTIKAKILALHGFDDPMVTADNVLSFEKEMSEKNVDWQLHAYGKTMHAFTNPAADDKKLGTVYNPSAEKRSFQSMYNFMDEIF